MSTVQSLLATFRPISPARHFIGGKSTLRRAIRTAITHPAMCNRFLSVRVLTANRLMPRRISNGREQARSRLPAARCEQVRRKDRCYRRDRREIIELIAE